jgi:hypothetical protein
MGLINKILGVLAIIGLLGSGIFFRMYTNSEEKAERTESAWKDAEKANKSLTLEYNELNKRQKKRIGEISDSLDIKPKFITRYVKIPIRDTVRITDTIYVGTVKIDSNTYAFNKDTACFSIEGLVKLTSKEPQVAITKLEYDNDIEYLVYLERRQMQWWIIKYKSLTKKDAKLEVVSECGVVVVEDVKIVK